MFPKTYRKLWKTDRKPQKTMEKPWKTMKNLWFRGEFVSFCLDFRAFFGGKQLDEWLDDYGFNDVVGMSERLVGLGRIRINLVQYDPIE